MFGAVLGIDVRPANYSRLVVNGPVDLAAPGVDVTSTLPAEAAGVFTDAQTFKTVLLPVQAEILEPASARDALIAGAVSPCCRS